MTKPPVFVGRAKEAESLVAAVRRAGEEAGTTIFIAGELGSGKQALLDEVQLRVRRDSHLSGTFFAKAICVRAHNADSAYEPFAGLLLDLIEESRERKRWDAIAAAVRDVAPDWLGMVPIAGPAIQAGVKTALRVQEAFAAEPEEERARRAQSRHLQFLAALDARLTRVPVVVLAISQAQWLDTASAGLLERVARLSTRKRVVILVTYRPADVGEDHVLHALVRDLRMDHVAEPTIELKPFDAEVIGELVHTSYGVGLAPEVADWLVSFAEGNPLFVSELLPVLDQRGIIVERRGVFVFHDDALLRSGELRFVGALAGTQVPTRVSDALDERVERLDQVLRDLLGIAAVEGPQFLTATLARVANADDVVLLQRLDEAEKRHRLVRYAEALQRNLFRYEFAHLLLHQRVYERLSEPLRVDYHSRIADALVETWGEDAPRSTLLDIAGHYEAGLDRPAAARFLLKAAESAQVDGASAQAANLSRRGLAQLAEASRGPRPPDTDAVQAELVAVLVAAKWEDVHAGDANLEDIIAQGKAAAGRVGDASLRARLLHAEARYVLGTKNVRGAVSALEQARELARVAADPISELAIAIDLGNTIAVEDLDHGLKILREALPLYEAKLAPLAADYPDLARLHARLIAFIGIGEFDRGDLGEGKRLLDASIRELEAIQRTEDFPRILNYRAQVDLAAGDFAGAEATVRRALEAAGDIGGPWASYNRALLGKILLDAGRIDLAGDEIEAAWRDIQAAWQVRLGTVVRQYLVEFLLRPGSSGIELEKAGELLAAQISDAEGSGFKNILVNARSQKAELELRRGRSREACSESNVAVDLLEASGDLPIVRTEEILWRHGRCLAEAGEPGAEEYFSKARAVVERKSASLDAESQRLHALTPVASALGDPEGRSNSHGGPP